MINHPQILQFGIRSECRSKWNGSDNDWGWKKNVRVDMDWKCAEKDENVWIQKSGNALFKNLNLKLNFYFSNLKFWIYGLMIGPAHSHSHDVGTFLWIWYWIGIW